MIPEFNEHGYLPAGVHSATLAEVEERFGHGSEDRVACGESLAWLVKHCRRAGIARLLVNGSFVTAAAEPRDVDCVLYLSPSYNRNTEDAKAIARGLPYLSLELVETADEFAYYLRLFGFDRAHLPKGILEIEL